mgnify:FL=1
MRQCIRNLELLISLTIAVIEGSIGEKIRSLYSEFHKKMGINYFLYYRLLIKVFGFKLTDIA